MDNRRGPLRWMADRLGQLSLTQKLTAIGVVSSTVSLAVVAAVLMALDAANAKQRLVRDTTLLADVVGANSTAAMVFKDSNAASETIRTVAVNDNIVSASLWSKDGEM